MSHFLLGINNWNLFVLYIVLISVIPHKILKNFFKIFVVMVCEGQNFAAHFVIHASVL